jgi:hypothetical protein
MKLTTQQLEFCLAKASRRRQDCAGVLEPDYLRQFPVADTPENLAERRAELEWLNDLVNKLTEELGYEHA